jgi:hypothetical protein
MSSDTGGMILIELCANSRPEKSALEPRDIPSGHSRLVNSIQYTRHGWEEMRLQHLRIFKESQRVASEIANGSADSDRGEFKCTLQEGRYK